MNGAPLALSDKALMQTPIARRQFLRGFASLAAFGGLSGTGAYAYGSSVERHRIVVVERDIVLPALPESLDGFRIVQLSDLHLEPWTKADTIAAAVRTANRLKPDLVVITGDFISSNVKPAGLLGELLSKLEAPHGVLACLGNHDVWHQPWVLQKALAERHIQVLRNQGVRLHTGRGSLFVAGVDSAWAGKPRLRPALRDWKESEPLVVLAHEPDVADRFAESGISALQLSGHTHGGQVCIPSLSPIALRLPSWGRKYVRGQFRIGNLQLYVNRGIGCVGLPVRFACPPEVTQISLRAPRLAGMTA